MKHKIIFLVVLMVAMIIAAVLVYNSAIVLSGRWGISVKAVDNISKGLLSLSLIPSMAINQIRKEARHE